MVVCIEYDGGEDGGPVVVAERREAEAGFMLPVAYRCAGDGSSAWLHAKKGIGDRVEVGLHDDVNKNSGRQGVRRRNVGAALVLDMQKVARKLAETAVVSGLLSEVFVEERARLRCNNRLQSRRRCSTLDATHVVLLKALAASGRWNRDDYEALAASHDLLPNAAYSTLNEVAFELAGDPVLEGDDPIEVVTEVFEEMLQL